MDETLRLCFRDFDLAGVDVASKPWDVGVDEVGVVGVGAVAVAVELEDEDDLGPKGRMLRSDRNFGIPVPEPELEDEDVLLLDVGWGELWFRFGVDERE